MKQLFSGLNLIFIIYFGLLSVLNVSWGLNLIFLILGGVLGISFILVDRLIHIYFTRPDDELSFQFKSLVAQRKYLLALKTLTLRANEQRYLLVMSVIFAAMWVPIALFVVTSTGSLFATGMILGIGLRLSYDLISGLSHINLLKWRLFWPVKKEFSDEETRGVVAGFGLWFILITLLV